MIQRVQTLYLLLSITSCAVLLYLPMGSISGQDEIQYFLNGFSVADDLHTFFNIYPLVALLGITMLIQAISIFDFKNRKRQVIMVQVSLILIVALAVGIMMYPDIAGIPIDILPESQMVEFTWNIIFIALPWILTYLGIRSIKKDEALIRSADRMR